MIRSLRYTNGDKHHELSAPGQIRAENQELFSQTTRSLLKVGEERVDDARKMFGPRGLVCLAISLATVKMHDAHIPNWDLIAGHLTRILCMLVTGGGQSRQHDSRIIELLSLEDQDETERAMKALENRDAMLERL